MRVIEWFGFIICLGSMTANGILRHKGMADTFWGNLTSILIFTGAIVTIIAFLFRKLRTKNDNSM
ncbi:hypothetical protein LG291_15475 [Cytobacillus firmus]|uniref:hypothetical protein n=1 Tax=Cytobacillus firmus TaxID=1399 RepID=UPI00384B1C54